MSLANDSTMVMPVAPAYQNGSYNNGMWGGGWDSWILLFLIFGMFGRGWGGWGGNESSCCAPATCADLQRGFDNQSVQNKLNGLENGLCDGFYAQNTNILNGFHGVDNAICQLGYQTQQGFNNTNVALMQGQNALASQLADCCCTTQRAIDGVNYNTLQNFNNLNSKIDSCCCETQRQIERGFCDTNYNLATNTTAIIQNAHNDTDRVIAKLNDMESARQAEKIAALQAENQSLKFQASQTAQNSYLTATMDANQAELIRRLGRDCPVPAYVVPNPNCCYGTPVGVLNNGCGCNNGCC